MTTPQAADMECTEMGAFDMEVALKEFLADQTRTELQLPHMTTGQRKQAKKLADEYAEVKCESYGFGPERRLHLFKQDAARSPEGGASLKKESAEEAEERPRSASSDRSTTASSPLRSPQNASALDDVEPLTPELSVRNTFIHFGGTGRVDERVVQSMPHGMFRQFWLEELRSAAPVEPTLPPPAMEAPKDIFAPGSEIMIEGLTKFPSFNGQQGKVQSFDEESGRYNVLLASHDGSAGQCAKLKGENLRLRVPPPPPFESVAQRPEELSQPPSPQPFQTRQCMPASLTWQDHQLVQQPFYDQPCTLIYAAR